MFVFFEYSRRTPWVLYTNAMMVPRVFYGLLLSLLIPILGASGRNVIPPLTENQKTRLAGAIDGLDHLEDAFDALRESFVAFDRDIGDALIRIDPDYEGMSNDPAAYRGDLCLLIGVLQQKARLPSPYENVAEWFLRDDAGRPFVVYLIDQGGNPSRGFQDGQRLEIVARFYKRLDILARDGTIRRYAGFVGASPKLLLPGTSLAQAQPGEPTKSPLAMIVTIVGVLGGVFLILFLYVRVLRKRNRSRPRLHNAGNDLVDAEAPLPDDPAEALEMLSRHADESASSMADKSDP